MPIDIAVVGIGCRFPGADNIDEFWRVLVKGENHVIDIPPDRWNNAIFYSENKAEKGKHCVKKAALLQRHDEWDNKFFGLSDYESAQVDPQQRYVLECTHMALEDGGITNKEIKGSDTGVFMGCMSGDYRGLFNFDHDDDNSYTVTGTNVAIISSRVSYVYDLRGPSMVVNTACSSSMTAIHLGCQAIKSGDCEMAICGGVGSILSPDIFIPASKAGMMSSIGQCQAFCSTADGYVRGEGCGVVILKSYEKALKDNNRIWGLIMTGVNQDGRVAQPMTAPAGEQQVQLLERLYKRHSVDPTSLQYIECHGTGTPVGDPVEVNALGQFIKSHTYQTNLPIASKSNRNKDIEAIENTDKTTSNILIGSVKTNIGHQEAAAGVAGLIKVLLMMHNGQFVPSLHAKIDKSNWNKRIKFDEYGFDISLTVAPWNENDNGERICSVNSFGFGGSNCHCIVVQKQTYLTTAIETKEPLIKVVCVTASDRISLLNAMEAFDDDLERSAHNLQDISVTSVFHRNHYKCRILLFGKSKNEIRFQISKQKAILENPETVKKKNIVFLFSGTGTAWKGMGNELIESQPKFIESVKELDDILEESTGFRMEEMFKRDTEYTDPFLNAIAIFYVQIGVFKIWKSWGIVPDVVVGQSVGEVAAAYASGALTLTDAARVIHVRSKYLSRQTGGKMMVTGNISLEIVNGICEKYDHKVIIAVFNSPKSFTLSGDADIMEKIKSDLVEMRRSNNREILIRPLGVQCAYHSHHIDPCLDELKKELSGLTGGQMVCRHISTVFGEQVQNNIFTNSQYWTENVRNPVRFMQAVKNSTVGDSTNIFVEIGPKPVLRAHMESLFTDQNRHLCVSSMRENWENHTLYSSLGKLFELGVDISWPSIAPSPGCVVPVLRYNFQKTKHLFLPPKNRFRLKYGQVDISSHMFLQPSESEGEEFCICISQSTTPFVFDHFFFDSCLVPGVTFVEAALEVGVRKTGLSPFEFDVSVTFHKTMTAENDKHQTISITLNRDDQILDFSARLDEKILCTGQVSIRKKALEKQKIEISKIKERCTAYYDKKACYDSLEKYHFMYGKSLKVVEEAWSSEKECLGRIFLPDSVMKDKARTHFHPSAIDSMLQTIATMRLANMDFSVPHLPKRLGSVVLNSFITESMFAYSHITKVVNEGYHFNCLLLDQNGLVIAEIRNFYFQKMNTDFHTATYATFHNVKWCLSMSKTHTDAVSDQRNEADQVVVLCSKPFAERLLNFAKLQNSIHVLCDSPSENKTSMPGWLKMTSLKSIAYAPCQHIQQKNPNESDIASLAKDSFLTLQYLLKYIEDQDLTATVYIVTESLWNDKTVSKNNILGSELWGMVRSAMLEYPEIDLRLVDIELNEENLNVFQNILQIGDIEEKELSIKDGKIFHSQISEYDIEEETPLTRNIYFDGSDEVVLRSKHPSFVKCPFFRLHKKEFNPAKLQEHCQIRLTEVYLHNPVLYPSTSEFLDSDETIWPEDSEEGYQVLSLEGCGSKIDPANKTNTVSTTGFCFPVEVASVISIPKECTYDISEIPCYQPGIVTVGVILWNVFEKASKCSCVVMNDGSRGSLWTQYAQHLLERQLNTVIIMKTGDNFHSEYSKHEQVETVVIMATISHKIMEEIIAKHPNVRQIISLEIYLSKNIKAWLEQHIEGVAVDVLAIENMFDPISLKQSVVNVIKRLRTFNEAIAISGESCLDETHESETDVINLPFKVIQITAQREQSKTIPLKVDSSSLFRKNACYVVVGGISGLGWELVKYMAELGAGYIVTFSRNRAPKEREDEMNMLQKEHDCRIIEMQVDITCFENLQTAIKRIKDQIEPASIRGVFHGGGVLRDKLLKHMSEQDIEEPLLPKIIGSWNLHLATLDCTLDFFVMHSSIAAIFGSHGQCNYAAGNSFQDALSRYRRCLGLCGQSINWGPLAVGMAKRNSRFENYWKSKGFHILTNEEIRLCFLKIMMKNSEEIICGKFDWAQLSGSPLVTLQRHKFDIVVDKRGGKQKRSKHAGTQFSVEEYAKLDEREKYKLIFAVARDLLSEAVLVDKDVLEEETTFGSIGIDSMSAMSLVNIIFDTIQVRVPLENLLSGTSNLKTLTFYLMQVVDSRRPTHVNIEKQDESRLVSKFEDMLRNEISFAQQSIIEQLASGRTEAFYIDQVEFQIQGVEVSKRVFQSAVKALSIRNKELRRIYIKSTGQKYTAKFLNEDQIVVDVEEVNIRCIDMEIDKRESIHFDLATDLPMKFRIARENGSTFVLAFLHYVAFDLASMGLFLQELFACIEHELGVNTVELSDGKSCVTDILSQTIVPHITDALQYWTMQMNQDSTRPFTLGQMPIGSQREQRMSNLSVEVSSEMMENLIDFTQKKSISLFEYLVATYFATLHEKTQIDVIPLVTRMNLRGSVPQLTGYIANCVNTIPLIVSFKNVGTVSDYLQTCCTIIRKATQHNVCPFDLILEATRDEELKTNIDRHVIVCDNMTNLNQQLARHKPVVKVGKFFHGGYYRETCLNIEYDTVQRYLNLTFQYASQIVTRDDAIDIKERLIEMIHVFMTNQNSNLHDLLESRIAAKAESISGNSHDVPQD